MNLLVFALIVVSKEAEYERLRARDEKFWRTGDLEWTSADPFYLAGRPFYSSAHVADVPLIEDIYFIANIPAMGAALTVSHEIASATYGWWTGSPRTSSAWESWTLGLVFSACGIVWAYLLGAAIDWLRESRAKV